LIETPRTESGRGSKTGYLHQIAPSSQARGETRGLSVIGTSHEFLTACAAVLLFILSTIANVPGAGFPTEVDIETARRVIEHPGVVSVGDSLFGFTPAQTYRFIKIKQEEE
jgi:hypothetical protein